MNTPEIDEAIQEEQRSRLRYTCQTCGNGCLVPAEEGVPMACHPGCPSPDWIIDAYQEPWIVGGVGWYYEPENDSGAQSHEETPA